MFYISCRCFLRLIVLSLTLIIVSLLEDDPITCERNMCDGINNAAHYCFQIKPLINAQKRLTELNKRCYDNGTLPQNPHRKQRYKIFELSEYVNQNKNFRTQNKELKIGIDKLHATIPILQQTNTNIQNFINGQQRKLELHIQTLQEQNVSKNDKINEQKRQIQSLSEQNAIQKAKITELETKLASKSNKDQQTSCPTIDMIRMKENVIADLNIQLEEVELRLSDCKKENKPTNKSTGCSNYNTGIHDIEIDNCMRTLSLRCNNDIDNGGWIVILQRFNGSENFYQNWNRFGKGFGNLNGEFFIGLKKLNCITNSQRFELYIEYKYFEGSMGIARYDNFRVGDEQSQYKLESLGQFSGTSSDQMGINLNQKFSTYDVDNDEIFDHCAKKYTGAWWFKSCEGPNPFGKYSKQESIAEPESMSWDGVHPIASIQMLIRGIQ